MGDAGNIMGKPTGTARRFAAFISYSHADAIEAAKLQRRLERYRLPKRIAETRATQATGLGAIFRDREDLAAAASLSRAIREAIASADALVIMCSPDAAASPWVAAEIELFRELHPHRPILAAILSGEPATAFPPALTVNGNEPLAADLRPEGDGAQLGFLKIVAGIAGVPLDSLIQRDAQRRIRRVTAITASALAAMLIMGIMTAYAIHARNEAARQRAAAEGLVEYMLTDLREKLRGVGRLEIMENVNSRAMQYYGAADSVSGLSDASLERRSRLLHAMGEDDLQSARFSEAFGKFAGAHRTTGHILANNPDKPDAIFAHSQSEYWLGYAAFRANRPTSTIRHFEQYKLLADRLVALEPDKPEWHREAGYANGNLCSHYLTEPKNPNFAVSFCKEALRNVQNYMASSKGGLSAKVDLANRFAWLADALFESGQVDRAWESRERQRELLEQLRAAEPKNADFVLHQVQYFIAIAKFPQTRANRIQSQLNYTKAKAELDRLVARDPQNKDTSSYIGKLRTAYAFLN
jgi:MTH538 TIR-like domain (DUF1863)